jgi:AcrR family transcriptional regulator
MAASAPRTLLTRALEAGPSVEGDETHERILDATLVEAEAKGLDRITMDAVAARAKVGRMTVYRRFGSKEELAAALAQREATRGLARIAAAVDPSGTIPAQVADGFVAALETARSHPLLQRLARFEPEVLLASFNDPGDPLFAMLRGFVAGQITATAGDSLRADPDQAAEILVRIGLSYLLIPGGIVDVGDEAAARRLAETLIAPIVA